MGERVKGALVFEYMKENDNASKSFAETMMNHIYINSNEENITEL